MEILEISKNNALKTYDQVNEKGKKFLENLFGKKTFAKDIKELIKTFDDALEYTGETIEQFNKRTEHDSPDEVAYKKLKVICLALNEGEVLDYRDTTKYKYYPWFYAMGSSGAGFSSHDYDCDDDRSDVGSRLLLKTSDLARYAGTQFTKEYNEWING